MTPPDTNLKKQRRRHWPVAWGIVAAFAIAFLGWLAVGGYLDEPDPDAPIATEDATAPSTDDNAVETGDSD